MLPLPESERKLDVAPPRYAERLEDPGLLCSRPGICKSYGLVLPLFPRHLWGVLVPLLSSICWVIGVDPTQQRGATTSPLRSLTPLIKPPNHELSPKAALTPQSLLLFLALPLYLEALGFWVSHPAPPNDLSPPGGLLVAEKGGWALDPAILEPKPGHTKFLLCDIGQVTFHL